MQIQFSDRPRYIYVDADVEERIQHGIPAPSAAAAVHNAPAPRISLFNIPLECQIKYFAMLLLLLLFLASALAAKQI